MSWGIFPMWAFIGIFLWMTHLIWLMVRDDSQWHQKGEGNNIWHRNGKAVMWQQKSSQKWHNRQQLWHKRAIRLSNGQKRARLKHQGAFDDSLMTSSIRNILRNRKCSFRPQAYGVLSLLVSHRLYKSLGFSCYRNAIILHMSHTYESFTYDMTAFSE